MDYCAYDRDRYYFSPHRITLSALYSAAAGVTTVLNSLILISIWKTPSLHKPSYILIASLALSDLLIGAVGEPLLVVENIAVLRRWSLETYCFVSKCAISVGYGLGAISLLTLTFISLDRLLAVKLRNRYQSVVTQKRVHLFLVTCWIAAFVISTLSSSLKLGYQAMSVLFVFVGIFVSISVVTIVVCYSMAFYSLRKITSSSVSPSIQNTEAVARPSANIDVAKYRKSLITMIVVFIVALLFYTPYVCSLITFAIISSQTLNREEIIYKTVTSAEFIALLNSAMNPLLYLWRIRDIREAVITTIRKTLKIT